VIEMKYLKNDKAPQFEPVKGVEMYLIGDGDNLTLIKMYIKPGSVFPNHSHPNEQVGTCMAGEAVLTSGGVPIDVRPGVTWTIPPGEEHSLVAGGDTDIVIYEAWSPPREDYRALAKES
jgi:quercetin dioxygenase-like cupin family protein